MSSLLNDFDMVSQGKVEVTIVGGRVVWQDGELKVAPGSGKYIEMPPFSYLFNGINKADAKYLSSLQAPVLFCILIGITDKW
ncbi:hypothetical protein F3Y22_tig00112888pilonHSYRG00056 [Hibiscus syriacus]|uniref:Uncharacterized protein n=1 Tax=Hibiscus syriacus TaxID=106335 RepID=A0A6A2WRV8_HIBSY|nr:hypothetical protein F3Y22_tig00112888pilonHSYRG00056 [Hibiscus syriacus]